MKPYTPEIEEAMRRFYDGLNEKDRRLYAGIEALKFGHGGKAYISQVLGCSRNTVMKGAKEVTGLSEHEVHDRIGGDKRKVRVRKAGGGRYSYEKKLGLEIDEKFLNVLRDNTAGDPMDEKIRWTNLTLAQIIAALNQDHNIQVSKSVVRKLLKKHGYHRRKAQKRITMKDDIPNRNEQFENIAKLKAEYNAAGNPVVSMDTKKKENLGNFYRDGHLYTLEEIGVNDHDFNSFSEGVVIPHSLYDIQLNIGYIQIGTSHDTSEFACDSFRHWWYQHGRQHYPNATSILVLCDGGGSNSSRHHLFKQDLQCLANEIGVEIRIAHYPPYCSKYNPIEHRLFPHVTRACQGVIFTSIKLVKELMEKTGTSTGLKTFVCILDKIYETGRKVMEGFKENIRIVFDGLLPGWNYRAIPATHVQK